MVIIIQSEDTKVLDITAKLLMDKCQGYAIPLPKRKDKSVRKIVGNKCNLDVMVSDLVQISIKS